MDTVVYRLHNARANYPILNQILMGKQVSGKVLYNTLSEDVPRKLHKRRFLLDYGSGKATPIRYSDDLHIPSSNHDIPISYDYDRDFLEINLSIPKYYFGNNVIELLVPPFHKTFSVNNNSPFNQVKFWRQTIKKVFYKVLMRFVQGNAIDLDWSDVEVYRIDIAINQVFQSKEEALRYLQLQHTIKRKHERDSGKKAAQWDNTVAFQSQRYYVKIYHKGGEFRDVQSKKIASIIKKKAELQPRQRIEKTRYEQALNELWESEQLTQTNLLRSEEYMQTLQEYSDRVLRYEFTFRPVMLSYLWNHHLNKRFSKHYKQFKKIHTYLKREMDSTRFLTDHKKKYVDTSGVLHSKIVFNFVDIKYFKKDPNGAEVEFTEKEYYIINLLHKYSIKERADIKKWLKFMDGEISGVRSFRIQLPNGTLDTTEREVLYQGTKVAEITAMTKTPKEVAFSSKLIYILVSELQKFFNNFQIENKSSSEEFEDKIAAYNDRQQVLINTALSPLEKQRLTKGVISSQLMRSLLQFHQLHTKNIKQKHLISKYFPSSTYYRLKKLYAEIVGHNHQIAHIHFGHINRDFTSIYKEVYHEILSGAFAKFYNNAFKKQLQFV